MVDPKRVTYMCMMKKQRDGAPPKTKAKPIFSIDAEHYLNQKG